MGYKVVRIPYFIQLTNEVIKIMFDRDIKEMMFNPDIPSMGVKGMNTPALLPCRYQKNGKRISFIFSAV